MGFVLSLTKPPRSLGLPTSMRTGRRPASMQNCATAPRVLSREISVANEARSVGQIGLRCTVVEALLGGASRFRGAMEEDAITLGCAGVGTA